MARDVATTQGFDPSRSIRESAWLSAFFRHSVGRFPLSICSAAANQSRIVTRRGSTMSSAVTNEIPHASAT